MSFRVFIMYTTRCLVARKVEETEIWNIRNARISVFFILFLVTISWQPNGVEFYQEICSNIVWLLRKLHTSNGKWNLMSYTDAKSKTWFLKVLYWTWSLIHHLFFTFQLLQQRMVCLLLQRWQSHLISLRRSEYTIGILFCDRAPANICAWSDPFCLFSLFLLWCIYFKLLYLFLHFGWWIDILFMLS